MRQQLRDENAGVLAEGFRTGGTAESDRDLRRPAAPGDAAGEPALAEACEKVLKIAAARPVVFRDMLVTQERRVLARTIDAAHGVAMGVHILPVIEIGGDAFFRIARPEAGEEQARKIRLVDDMNVDAAGVEPRHAHAQRRLQRLRIDDVLIERIENRFCFGRLTQHRSPSRSLLPAQRRTQENTH